MNRHFQNAQFFFSQKRYTDAEKELKQSLAENPNDAWSLALLAACRIHAGDFGQAIKLAQQSITLEPWNPSFFSILARAYFYNNEPQKARETTLEGQRISPNDPVFFAILSDIEFQQENWEKALENANQGLELDPEDLDLVNLRAKCLIQLNRQDEAAQTLDYALHKSPENSYAHANKGWVAIEKDQYDDALRHFKEALRLDPQNEFARHGLKQAIKAKNVLYRGILKYFLWMGKMQENYRWGFIIGIYLLYRLLLKAYETFPQLAPLLLPLIIFYILFAFSTWIATPLSNLFLRLHPVGKYALTKDEIHGSNAIGILALGGGLALLGWFFTDWEVLLFLGGYFIMMMIPVGGIFSLSEHKKARRYMIIYSVLLALSGALWLIYPQITGFLIAFGLGIFFYGWVVNYFLNKEAKEF
ncbi:MAG: tetratricopeptide repeat protein [Bacteroidetes bacterium]|nr:MAG: tetratricopeptide repeat protein [Bacteroidota bacterium]